MIADHLGNAAQLRSFGEEEIRSARETGVTQVCRVGTGQDDDSTKGSLALNLFQDLQAMYVRQVQVQDDNIRLADFEK